MMKWYLKNSRSVVLLLSARKITMTFSMHLSPVQSTIGDFFFFESFTLNHVVNQLFIDTSFILIPIYNWNAWKIKTEIYRLTPIPTRPINSLIEQIIYVVQKFKENTLCKQKTIHKLHQKCSVKWCYSFTIL